VSLAGGLAATILVSLIVYVLLAGADFGGGAWDLLARGPRAARQREAVAHAIGPIWEANHVWMIVAIVLLFTAFPPAFAVIMTALHVPVTLMLVGIVLRGSAFAFRKVGPDDDPGASRWQLVFAVSSVLTPVMIGVVLGTISTPVLGYRDGVVTGGFFDPWMRPFPWTVGLMTVSLFAFLAAVYLTVEVAGDPPLADDFRRRGLGAGAAVAVSALAAAALAPGAAPDLAAHLLASGLGRAIMILAALSLAGSLAALALRAWRAARLGAAGTAVLVLLGWGSGQHPWLVAGAVGIQEAAAPRVTLLLVAWILGLGSLVLVPAFAYLYLTFKGRVLVPRRVRERG
jgi:cytochrome d ubiquinol oxidase subunit II